MVNANGSNQLHQALEQLPPIVLPEPPAFWPPAPGWWILAITAIVIGIFVARCLRRRFRIRDNHRAAISELDQLHQRFKEDNDASTFLSSAAQLLRRFALTLPEHHTIAASSPAKIVAQLNPLSNANIDERSSKLLQQHYLPPSSAPAQHEDVEHLYQQLCEWLKHFDKRYLCAPTNAPRSWSPIP